METVVPLVLVDISTPANSTKYIHRIVSIWTVAQFVFQIWIWCLTVKYYCNISNLNLLVVVSVGDVTVVSPVVVPVVVVPSPLTKPYRNNKRSSHNITFSLYVYVPAYTFDKMSIIKH